MMWTKIEVKNFRVIGEEGLSLSLAPLTVFVGENGTGKSALLEALALTAQSVHDPQRRRGLVLSGDLISLPEGSGSWKDKDLHLYHKKEGERTLAVELEWEEPFEVKKRPFSTPPMPALWKDLAWPPKRFSYRWEQTQQSALSWRHTLKAGGTELVNLWREILSVSREGSVSFRDWAEINGLSGKFEKQTPEGLLEEGFPFRYNEFPRGLEGTFQPSEAKAQRDLFEEVAEASRWMAGVLREVLKKVSVLLPLRGLQLTQKDTGPDIRVVGKHGEQTFRLLANLQSQRQAGFAKLCAWAGRFGMKDLKAAWAGGNQLKVNFFDPSNGTLLEAEEGATGSKQMLMLLAHLLLSAEPMTCIVEEPECNLHPAYEKMLPELFADSIRQGNQLLVSTHSEIVIAALGQAVRSKKLAPSEVKIWHLERKGPQIQAQEIPITDRGRLKGWVASFAKVEEELFDEWLEESPTDESPVDR